MYIDTWIKEKKSKRQYMKIDLGRLTDNQVQYDFSSNPEDVPTHTYFYDEFNSFLKATIKNFKAICLKNDRVVIGRLISCITKGHEMFRFFF